MGKKTVNRGKAGSDQLRELRRELEGLGMSAERASVAALIEAGLADGDVVEVGPKARTPRGGA